MKKTALICLTYILSYTINAQEDKKATFGIKVGLNSSKLNVIEDDPQVIYGYLFSESNSNPSLTLGVLVEIPLSKSFSIQPELVYSSLSYSFYSDGIFGSIAANNKVDFIKVPILLKYYIVKNFSLEIGGVFGGVVKNREKYQSNGGGLTLPSSTSQGEREISGLKRNKRYIGGQIGIGYKLNSKFNFQLNYASELDSKNYHSLNAKSLETSINFFVGYLF